MSQFLTNSAAFMNDLAATPLWSSLGWTMWHYLWIGLIELACGILLLAIIPRFYSALRYRFLLVLFALLFVTPIFIFQSLWNDAARIDHSQASEAVVPPIWTTAPVMVRAPALEFVEPDRMPNALQPPWKPDSSAEIPDRSLPQVAVTYPQSPPQTAPKSNGFGPLFFERLAKYVPWLPLIWMIGSPLTLLFLGLGLIGAERYRRQARIISSGHIVDQCTKLAARIGVRQKVLVAFSERVISPVLIGILQPLILLPITAETGWTPAQLEIVLLHELAHVRRWDNLVNLIQRLAEGILFFQPAVWIVSRWLTLEREHCCDELVVRVTGRAQDYATALAELALAEHLPPGVVSSMARHPLLGRIRRILGHEQPLQVSRATLTFALIFSLGCCALAGLTQGVEETEQPKKEVERAIEDVRLPANETVPVEVVSDGLSTEKKAQKEPVEPQPTSDPLAPKQPDTPQPVTELPPKKEISLIRQIVDHHGQGLKGVKVTLFTRDLQTTSGDKILKNSFETKILAETETDSTGAIGISFAIPEASVSWIELKSPGYATRRAQLNEVLEGVRSEQFFRMTEGANVRLKVLDPKGEPLPGAILLVSPSEHRPTETVISDVEGIVSLNDLPPGLVGVIYPFGAGPSTNELTLTNPLLTAFVSQFEEEYLQTFKKIKDNIVFHNVTFMEEYWLDIGKTLEQTIDLRECRSRFEGNVVDKAGNPAPHQDVWIWRLRPDTPLNDNRTQAWGGPGRLTLLTDEQGRFTLNRLNSGKYMFAPLRKRSDSQRILIDGKQDYSRGFVIDPLSLTREFSKLEASPVIEDQHSPRIGHVDHPSDRLIQRTEVLENEGTDLLKRRWRIVDLAGSPIQGAEVVISAAPERQSNSTGQANLPEKLVSDEEGWFEGEFPRGKRLRLALMKEGFLPVRLDFIDGRLQYENQETIAIRRDDPIEMMRCGTLAVTVLGNGKPVSGKKISLTNLFSIPSVGRNAKQDLDITNEKGEVTFRNLREGIVVLRPVEEQAAPVTDFNWGKPIFIADGTSNSVTIDTSIFSATLEGSFSSSSGEGVEGILIEIEREFSLREELAKIDPAAARRIESASVQRMILNRPLGASIPEKPILSSVRTGQVGQFRIEGLLPGKYVVRAMMESEKIPVTVVRPDGPQVELRQVRLATPSQKPRHQVQRDKIVETEVTLKRNEVTSAILVSPFPQLKLKPIENIDSLNGGRAAEGSPSISGHPPSEELPPGKSRPKKVDPPPSNPPSPQPASIERKQNIKFHVEHDDLTPIRKVVIQRYQKRDGSKVVADRREFEVNRDGTFDWELERGLGVVDFDLIANGTETSLTIAADAWDEKEVFSIALGKPRIKGVQDVATSDFERMKLRYDGKPFHEWVQVLRTEIKTERIVEAIEVMLYFGSKGYQSEAASEVVAALRRISSVQEIRERTSSALILSKAIITLNLLGKDSVPSLAEMLRDQDDSQVIIGLEFLSRFSTEPWDWPDKLPEPTSAWQAVPPSFGENQEHLVRFPPWCFSPEIGKELSRLLKHPNPEIRARLTPVALRCHTLEELSEVLNESLTDLAPAVWFNSLVFLETYKSLLQVSPNYLRDIFRKLKEEGKFKGDPIRRNLYLRSILSDLSNNPPEETIQYIPDILDDLKATPIYEETAYWHLISSAVSVSPEKAQSLQDAVRKAAAELPADQKTRVEETLKALDPEIERGIKEAEERKTPRKT